jgi:hypothetical protein
MIGPEASLYPPIGRFLERRGYRVGFQVRPRPGSPRSFDVVGVNTSLRRIVAVEAKMDHFQRTVTQALLRRFVADLVYVSFPIAYANRVVDQRRRILRSHGLGLLGVSGRSVRELLPPRQSTSVSALRKDQLIGMALCLSANHE